MIFHPNNNERPIPLIPRLSSVANTEPTLAEVDVQSHHQHQLGKFVQTKAKRRCIVSCTCLLLSCQSASSAERSTSNWQHGHSWLVIRSTLDPKSYNSFIDCCTTRAAGITWWKWVLCGESVFFWTHGPLRKALVQRSADRAVEQPVPVHRDVSECCTDDQDISPTKTFWCKISLRL